LIDKNTIRDLILEQCDICLHLAEKVPAGGLDYRPTPGQRSTLELLRYLSFCGLGATRTMAEGNWDGYKALAEASEAMTAEAFPTAMAAQKEALTAYFEGLTQADLDKRIATTPLGVEMPLGKALLQLPFSWMVAYRMQLFLYVKQAGTTDIGTANCWAGIDWEPPAPAEAPEA
jgi:hypothetical protein